MAADIIDVMTPDPVTCDARDTAMDAAAAMRDYAIGDVIVLDGEQLYGLVTDRDLVLRVLAAGLDPCRTALAEVASTQVGTLAPDDDVQTAVELMTRHAVRRIPIVSNGVVVGVVTIGDLAQFRDEHSALAAVSAAPPNA